MVSCSFRGGYSLLRLEFGCGLVSSCSFHSVEATLSGFLLPLPVYSNEPGVSLRIGLVIVAVEVGVEVGVEAEVEVEV